MFIEQVTGVTEKPDIQIQKSCKEILIVSTTNVITGNEKATLKIVGRTGNKVLFTDTPLMDLAEIRASGDSLWHKDLQNYVGVASSLPVANVRSIMSIPLSVGGAYDLADDEYISLDLKSIVAATQYRISAIESLDGGGKLHVVDQKTIPQSRTRQAYQVQSDSKFIALRANRTDLAGLKLWRADGQKDLEYTYEELSGIAMQENEIVATVARAVATTPVVNVVDTLYGHDRFILVSLAGCKAYEVINVGTNSYSFYEVRHVG